jgi:hypothetical protein
MRKENGHSAPTMIARMQARFQLEVPGDIVDSRVIPVVSDLFLSRGCAILRVEPFLACR